MPTQLCVVEIEDTGVLLDGGEEMTLAEACRMAKIHTQKWPGRRVRILQGGSRKHVQTWQDGERV